jgi:REP element-mobilizing transposase RayT
MARPLRIEFPGAVYHVTARGNAKNDIFVNDGDRQRFLDILTGTVQRYNWICHAYCLMNNHYHLLIETTDPTLSIGMRQLNGVYTQAFNRIHDRVGHVFQGRFKSIIVEKDAHLLELCRYIVLNPVRAGMVPTPDEWNWSSYRFTLLVNKRPELLTTDWILGQFSDSRAQAQNQYRVFVENGLKAPCPWNSLKGQVFYGSDFFVDRMQDFIGGKKEIQEIPRHQRLPNRPELNDLFPAKIAKDERNKQIVAAHLEYGYSLAEIGKQLGIHYSTVSRIVKKQKCFISRPDPKLEVYS